MHQDFPRWYREVAVDSDRERLQRRWAGITVLIEQMKRNEIEALIRIAFRAKTKPSADDLNRIRQAFKSQDDLFDMQGNDRELEILCGSALAELIEGSDDVASACALSITTTFLGGSRTVSLPMDLPGLAENAIKRISEENRTRPTTGSLELSDLPKITFAGPKEKFQQAFDQNTLGSAFDAAAVIVDGLRKSIVAATKQTGRYIAIQDEELEILWWLFGERSGDLNLPFKDVPIKAQPLVFAKELAEATVYLPGPISIKAMLLRAGLKDNKKLSIPDAVNASTETWLKSVITSEAISPLSQPIHFAIARKLETNDDTSWVAGWANTSEVSESQSLSAPTLGELFYRERLLSLFPE
jgi:hypothetical protein